MLRYKDSVESLMTRALRKKQRTERRSSSERRPRSSVIHNVTPEQIKRGDITNAYTGSPMRNIEFAYGIGDDGVYDTTHREELNLRKNADPQEHQRYLRGGPRRSTLKYKKTIVVLYDNYQRTVYERLNKGSGSHNFGRKSRRKDRRKAWKDAWRVRDKQTQIENEQYWEQLADDECARYEPPVLPGSSDEWDIDWEEKHLYDDHTNFYGDASEESEDPIEDGLEAAEPSSKPTERKPMRRRIKAHAKRMGQTEATIIPRDQREEESSGIGRDLEAEEPYWALHSCEKIVRDPHTRKVLYRFRDMSRQEPRTRKPISGGVKGVLIHEETLNRARNACPAGSVLLHEEKVLHERVFCDDCAKYRFKRFDCHNARCFTSYRYSILWGRPKTGGRPIGEERREAREHDDEQHWRRWYKRQGTRERERRSNILGRRAYRFLGRQNIKISNFWERRRGEDQIIETTKQLLSPRKPKHKFHRRLDRSWKETNFRERIDEGEWLLNHCDDLALDAQLELIEKFGDEHDQRRELEEKDHEYLQWWLDHHYVAPQEEVERNRRFARHMADSGTASEFLKEELAAEEEHAKALPKPRRIIRAPWRGSLQPNVSTSAD